MATSGRRPCRAKSRRVVTRDRKSSRPIVKGSQALPYLTALRSAAGELPPTQIGGPAAGGLGEHQGRVQAVEPALVAGLRLAPERLQHLDRFVGHRGSVREVRAQACGLLLPVANAHAEDEASAGKQIQGSGLFGHQDGVALGQDEDDARPEPGPKSGVRSGRFEVPLESLQRTPGCRSGTHDSQD